MRRLPLLLALVLLLGACGDDSGSTQDGDEEFDSPTETTESGDDSALPEGAVVFTPDDAETDINGDAVTWTPATEDVLAAEEALAAHIEANPDLGVEGLDTYHRQYVGTGEDSDVVSVNALCESAELDDWEDELILVNDGGSCFWQAEVARESLEVESFTVNGEA